MHTLGGNTVTRCFVVRTKNEEDMTEISEKQYLKDYNINDYDRPSVATDIVIFSIYEEAAKSQRKMAEGKLSVLMIRRKEHPFAGCWALPGGFLRKDETIEECALRELREETGVADARLDLIGAFSRPGRDARGWIISNAFMAPVYRGATSIRGGDDAAEAVWYSLDAIYDNKASVWRLTLDSEEREEAVRLTVEVSMKKGMHGIAEFETINSEGIAFDHSEIILKALLTLRKHLEADALAYEFLPEKFTIMQLQKTYEIVLEKELLAANFRRKMFDEIEETGEIQEGKAFRPAMLYRKKED